MKAKSIYVENVSTSLITSTATTIYTVPSNTRSKVVYVLLSNNTGSTISGVTVQVYNAAGIQLVYERSLTAGERLDLAFGEGYIMLEAGYEIRARAGATGVSCVATVEETTGLVSTN